MRAHAGTGDFKAVDTVYRAHTDGRRRILNTDPKDSTVELHQELTLARVH